MGKLYKPAGKRANKLVRSIMLLHLIAGARPNFVKIAPIYSAAVSAGVPAKIIHTGQHYDHNMSQVFFSDLALPTPHKHLEVGSGTHAEVTARALERLEVTFQEERPDWVVVVGDVNSTLAGALAATKLGIRCAHVEAGLRSFDRTMPEELNRIATDAVCDLLLASEPAGVDNLHNEGKSFSTRLVGNVMIDSLFSVINLLKKPSEASPYALVTMHRPANVDSYENISDLINLLQSVSDKIHTVFPIHPRTSASIEKFGMQSLLASIKRLSLIPAQGYIDFISLLKWATVVITDSGGVQEETTALQVPCLTVRNNTERPITVTEGTNTLVGAVGHSQIYKYIDDILTGGYKLGHVPKFWDGHAGERVIDSITQFKGA